MSMRTEMNMKERKFKMKHTWIWRGLLIFLCLALSIGGISGCSRPQHDNRGDGVLRVVCTTYAAYDMARSVIGPGMENSGITAEILLLGRPGQDMHSYEPSAQDIVTLSTADLLISVGDTAEPWIKGALSSADNPQLLRVDMMTVCGVMGGTCDLDHDHDHEHSSEMDEHVWVSLKNAIKISEAIAETAMEVLGDQEKAKGIATARDAYVAQLSALDEAYADMVAHAKRKELLVADRYPFAHLMADYGLICHAAFPGCSSETEAYPAVQAELIRKVEELGLSYIFVVDGSDRKVAENIAKETGVQLLLLHSCQVMSKAELDAGLSYLDIARNNLANLSRALCE